MSFMYVLICDSNDDCVTSIRTFFKDCKVDLHILPVTNSEIMDIIQTDAASASPVYGIQVVPTLLQFSRNEGGEESIFRIDSPALFSDCFKQIMSHAGIAEKSPAPSIARSTSIANIPEPPVSQQKPSHNESKSKSLKHMVEELTNARAHDVQQIFPEKRP